MGQSPVFMACNLGMQRRLSGFRETSLLSIRMTTRYAFCHVCRQCLIVVVQELQVQSQGKLAFTLPIFESVLRTSFYDNPRSFGYKVLNCFESSLLERPQEKEIPASMLALVATAVRCVFTPISALLISSLRFTPPSMTIGQPSIVLESLRPTSIPQSSSTASRSSRR